MKTIIQVRRKYSLLDRQIDQLLDGEFPYENPRKALIDLKGSFAARLALLDEAQDDSDEEEIINACQNIVDKIYEYHPILGIVLRATNLRNAFEVFDPLQRLLRQLIDGKPRLILSSEWNFSPFTVVPYISQDLPQYVFVGFPVSECGNALMIPLAGHEFGHWIWSTPPLRDQSLPSLGSSISKRINSAVFERFCRPENRKEAAEIFGVAFNKDQLLFDDSYEIRRYYLDARSKANRQCEELFCDILGVRIFGYAYVKAFEYLISPGGFDRAAKYPSLDERFKCLNLALKSFGYDQFWTAEPGTMKENPVSGTDRFVFSMRMADEATQEFVQELVDEVITYCEERNIPFARPDEAKKFAELLNRGRPIENATCMADIMNAGWMIHDTILDGKGRPGLGVEILNQLIYKSLEVFEFEYRIGK